MHRGRKPPQPSLTRFIISGPAVHVRPGTPYSAATMSIVSDEATYRTIKSSSAPPTNASATMTNVRRLGLIPAHILPPFFRHRRDDDSRCAVPIPRHSDVPDSFPTLCLMYA